MSRALIVDDSRAIRTILRKILERYGFATMQAADGVEALALLGESAEPLQLVCVDYNMPEMNGIEFLEQARALNSLEGVPAMMITTETHVDLMRRAFAAGASEYLMKPFTEAMVREKLDILRLLPEEVYE